MLPTNHEKIDDSILTLPQSFPPCSFCPFIQMAWMNMTHKSVILVEFDHRFLDIWVDVKIQTNPISDINSFPHGHAHKASHYWKTHRYNFFYVGGTNLIYITHIPQHDLLQIQILPLWPLYWSPYEWRIILKPTNSYM